MQTASPSSPEQRSRKEAAGGAEFSAQSRHLATLLTIEGDVDGRNSDELYRRCARFILPGTALLLDTSAVSSFSQEGVELVDRLADSIYTRRRLLMPYLTKTA